MSILSYSGGCCIAMKGKDCVAIGCDNRLGSHSRSLANDYERVIKIGSRTFLCLCGLQTDSLTVKDRIMFRKNLYELRENREMSPSTFASVLSSFLYEHRHGPYFVEPVIAGLDGKKSEPFVCNMDLLGCRNEPQDFVVSGTCSEQLFGVCEAYWKPDLGPDQLFQVMAHALKDATDRDAFSGMGATIYMIQKDKCTKTHVQTRSD